MKVVLAAKCLRAVVFAALIAATGCGESTGDASDSSPAPSEIPGIDLGGYPKGLVWLEGEFWVAASDEAFVATLMRLEGGALEAQLLPSPRDCEQGPTSLGGINTVGGLLARTVTCLQGPYGYATWIPGADSLSALVAVDIPIGDVAADEAGRVLVLGGGPDCLIPGWASPEGQVEPLDVSFVSGDDAWTPTEALAGWNERGIDDCGVDHGSAGLPVFGPTGDLALFASQGSGSHGLQNIEGPFDLFVVTAAGDVRTVLQELRYPTALDWSPNGRCLMAASAAGLHLVDLVGDTVWSIADDTQPKGLAWSDDGSQVALAYGDPTDWSGKLVVVDPTSLDWGDDRVERCVDESTR